MRLKAGIFLIVVGVMLFVYSILNIRPVPYRGYDSTSRGSYINAVGYVLPPVYRYTASAGAGMFIFGLFIIKEKKK